MCVFIIIVGGVVLLMIFVKGRMLFVIVCVLLCVICGKLLWLFIWVLLWFGKCLIVFIIFVFCIVLINVCLSVVICFGFFEKLCMLIMGFFGLLFILIDGVKLVFIFSGKSVCLICDVIFCVNVLFC